MCQNRCVKMFHDSNVSKCQSRFAKMFLDKNARLFQGKIASINQRVDNANAKLEVLKATKKATVVFSSARQAFLILQPLFSGTLEERKVKTLRAFLLLWKMDCPTPNLDTT